MKDNNVKGKIKKVLAVMGLILILFLVVMMIVETIRGRGQMAFAYIVGLIFVSIVFYIALFILKRND